MKKLLLVATLALLAATPLRAQTYTLNPVADGDIAMCDCSPVYSTSWYLWVSTMRQGDIRFSTAGIHGPVKQALFSIGNYLEPVGDLSLQVYGFASASGQLDPAERNNGSLIGTLTLPGTYTFGYGSLDVTAFVNATLAAAPAPYLDFTLRSDGIDAYGQGPYTADYLNSLAYNYGRPAQLTITPVPEPSQSALLLAGLAALGWAGRRRLRQNGAVPGLGAEK